MVKLKHYVQVGQKKLRCGYTTGTCAAAAARGAAELLLTGTAPAVVQLMTPAGIPVEIDIEEFSICDSSALCGVQKDGGDDPDITDGILIFAEIRKRPEGIFIDGGEGVGRVTREGLNQPIGNAAINSVPRAMIREQLRLASQNAGYSGGWEVLITIPQGRELAEKTFNPRLGIVGGLSVLGTSGIVRPMSEEALMASIHLELDTLKAAKVQHLLVSPGNYGADFCRDCLSLDLTQSVQCSNYIGDTIDYAASSGSRSFLLVGHVGKLVKCAAGVMNTHSRVADCRMETLAAYCAIHGGGSEITAQVLNAVTTDAAIAVLTEHELLTPVMDSVMSAIGQHLQRRSGKNMQVEAVMFSNQHGLLGMTAGAKELLELHRKDG